MATDIVMPNLGFDAQSGVLVEWVKQLGDTVKRGDVLAVVESDKANVELESVASGTLLELLYKEGDEVNVGEVLARIGEGEVKATPASAPPAASVATAAPASAPPNPPSAPPAPRPVATSGATQVVEVSPVARRMAQEHNLDLAGVVGTGHGGRITREDVQALISGGTNGHHEILALPKVRKTARDAGIDLTQIRGTGAIGQITMADLQAFQAQAAAPVPVSAASPAPEPMPNILPDGVTEIPLSRMRQTIGNRLQQSKNDAPHFYVTGEFDLENAFATLASYPDPQPRINDLLQFIVVQCLRQVPELNATFKDGQLLQHHHVNLAIAVAKEEGLITPVLQGAERFSITGLASESRALIKRTRANRLQPDDLQGGTFTISNLGIIPQVDHFTAVINPPQVGILAVGTVKPRPVVVNGGLHVRRTVQITLSGDHRVVDGMHLGRFMAAFQAELDRFASTK